MEHLSEDTFWELYRQLGDWDEAKKISSIITQTSLLEFAFQRGWDEAAPIDNFDSDSYDEGHEDGFAIGFTKGYREGIEEALATIEDHHDDLRSAIKKLKN